MTTVETILNNLKNTSYEHDCLLQTNKLTIYNECLECMELAAKGETIWQSYCGCKEENYTKTTCNICDIIKENIDNYNCKVDTILYNLGDRIKHVYYCDAILIKELQEITFELRKMQLVLYKKQMQKITT